MKSGFLAKLIERVDRVEPGQVQNFLVRLVQEKGFLERVFDALQEGVIVLDITGRITYLNSAACRLFGLDRDDSVGELIGAGIPGFQLESLVSKGKVVSRDLELFYPENKFLNFYLAPLESEDAGNDASDPLGFVMIVRDITHNRQLEEEKIESEKFTALTMLAAGVAHEIGNPLNSLNIHLQLIERKLRKADKATRESLGDLLEIARDEIKRLDSIVDQFLGAIRPAKPQLELVDINQLLSESAKFFSPELKDRGVKLRLELRSSIPLINLDKAQMKQAFYNLIRNANQAMGKGGTLKVKTGFVDGDISVSFEDTGSGISAENMGNLFEPYYTTRKSGTGLGLLIVRRIAREHGGEIEIESREHKGTKVTMFLPIAPRGVRFLEAGAAAAAADSEPHSDTKNTIIDVE